MFWRVSSTPLCDSHRTNLLTNDMLGAQRWKDRWASFRKSGMVLSGLYVSKEAKVAGDIVMLRLGDVVPADCFNIEQSLLQIDQSSLTGESLPVTKSFGDPIFSGSFGNFYISLWSVSHRSSETRRSTCSCTCNWNKHFLWKSCKISRRNWAAGLHLMIVFVDVCQGSLSRGVEKHWMVFNIYGFCGMCHHSHHSVWSQKHCMWRLNLWIHFTS